MQTTPRANPLQTFVARGTTVANSVVEGDQPVELDLASLSHVSGGAPQGTWGPHAAAASTPIIYAPQGTW